MAPPVVLEQRVTDRLICPAELDQELPPDDPVPAGALIRHNDVGGAWLDRKFARGDAAARLFNDAKTACAVEVKAGARTRQ